MSNTSSALTVSPALVSTQPSPISTSLMPLAADSISLILHYEGTFLVIKNCLLGGNLASFLSSEEAHLLKN